MDRLISSIMSDFLERKPARVSRNRKAPINKKPDLHLHGSEWLTQMRSVSLLNGYFGSARLNRIDLKTLADLPKKESKQTVSLQLASCYCK